MGTMHPLLKIWVGLLAPCRESLHPKEQGLPVDPDDHLKGQKGVLERKTQEGGITERDELSSEEADEFWLIFPEFINGNPEVLIRQVESKIKEEIKVGERGNIKVFHDMRMEGSLGCEGDKIRFPLAEGIANFGH